ncbi:hypothetical protein HNO51_04535 [Billgrantia sulfidoxydans]|uniref:NADH-quinone oxidoreductase subunit D domain-containing protein n=1 Tax=Billgrantia sulfidoxydans TaxID=2733484 RepID=A0ABX7W2F0_9GAMM|nr:hypothetical protein [Halomonas sulfidoxydans]QTP54011.1 hypothetical protein HNO51_04535 [Halomonas sulfidoxydans]
MSWQRRLAARAPAAVFLAEAARIGPVRETLALVPGIRLVDTPRHASVLLVAGVIPTGWRDDLRRIHDQLPAPFASVWCRCEPFEALRNPIRIDVVEALPQGVVETHRELMLGKRDSAPRLLPDEPPNPWEGLGDDGHGGEGMMGGTPYGRPMAMNMQDDRRDGLTLDTLTFRLGPFHSALPPGLQAEVSLQGDLVQAWTVTRKPFAGVVEPIFHAARQSSVPIAELELARARHHLHRLYRGLWLAGWPTMAERALRLAEKLGPNSDVAGLRRELERGGLWRLALPEPGRGVLDEAQARQLGGPAARAAGIDADLRSEDASYRRLGFAPTCREAGDTAARWRQWLDEIEQSLSLAGRAARYDLKTAETAAVETPRGPWAEGFPHDMSDLLGEVLPELEWGEALLTLASLDVAALDPLPLANDWRTGFAEAKREGSP